MIEALPPPYLSSKETTSSPYDPTSTSPFPSEEPTYEYSVSHTDYEGMNENLIHYQSTNTNYEKQPLLTSPSSLPFIEDLEAGTLVIKPSRSSLKSHNGHRVLGGKCKKSKRVKFKKDPKYRHRDRLAYGYIGEEEKETSWLTFFLLLLLVFTMVCGAGVFIAWALGFAGGKAVAAAAGGLHTGIIAAAAAGPGAIPVNAVPVVAAGSAPVVQEVNGVPKKEGVTKRKLEKRLLDGVRERLRLRLGGVAIAPEKRDASPEEVKAAPVGRHYYKRSPVHEENHEGGEDASSNKRKHKRSMGHEEYVQSADMVF
ncbi:hypothetical protein TWF970_006982 [Orbilia oligospora]|uniref:Uncharacterized protein n=1 Tax=Orbilia oligospora TaxID=2813651 RepID=A0A7C8VBL9_ORBOL|nr:hypothetical protein TWF970_006982 [Orbilia oligospora]